jgi:hypothetical protein
VKPTRWTSEQWADNDLFLMGRAAGSCERCGKECGPVERHHRKRRREGGDSLENLVVLGRSCHAEVHAHPVESRRTGFIVSMSKDPADIPILWHLREWVYLGPDGDKHPLGEELADAHNVKEPPLGV